MSEDYTIRDGSSSTASFGTDGGSCPCVTGAPRSYTEADYSKQRADLVDAYGSVKASTYYGAGNIKEHTATFALDCSGAITSPTLGASGVAEISISTSNGDWPTVTVKWYTGLPQCQSGCTYAVTVPTVQGKRMAQALGFTVTGDVQSSTWTASAQLNLLLDGDGEPVAYAFSGGTITASVEAVGGTISAGSGMTITNNTSSESNTGYATVSATGEQVLQGTPVSGS
jgi:hypothetical protein